MNDILDAVKGYEDTIKRLKSERDSQAEEIERLKNGVCEHVEQDVISGDCKLCELAVAEKGYPIWVEKAKELQKQLEECRAERDEIGNDRFKVNEENTELSDKVFDLKAELAAVKQERDELREKASVRQRIRLCNKIEELEAENKELREALEDIKHLSEIRRDISEPDIRDKTDKSLIRAYAIKALKKEVECENKN